MQNVKIFIDCPLLILKYHQSREELISFPCFLPEFIGGFSVIFFKAVAKVMLVAVTAAAGYLLYLHRSTENILLRLLHPLFRQKADKGLPRGLFDGGAQIVGTDM